MVYIREVRVLFSPTLPHCCRCCLQVGWIYFRRWPQPLRQHCCRQGNYTVVSSAGSIPAIGRVPHTSGAQAGHARSAPARFSKPASGASQHPQQRAGVPEPPPVHRLPSATHTAGRSITAVGGLNRLPTPGLSDAASTGPSMSLLTQQSFGETNSPGSGAGLSSYSEVDHGEDLVNLQVHSATTATLFKRDAVMSHLNNKVSAKNVALLRSTSLLGPMLFDKSMVRKANKDLMAAVALSQGVDSTKAMVSLASTAQQFMQKTGHRSCCQKAQ